MPLCRRTTSEHSAQFRHALGSIEGLDAGFGATLAHFLDHLIVGRGCRGDRGSMRDAQHLMFRSDGRHLLADRVGGLASDSRIDFIEDQHRDRILIGQDGLEGQHDTGEFATGSDGPEGAGGLAWIRSELKFHSVHPGFGGLGRVRIVGESGLEAALPKT